MPSEMTKKLETKLSQRVESTTSHENCMRKVDASPCPYGLALPAPKTTIHTLSVASHLLCLTTGYFLPKLKNPTRSQHLFFVAAERKLRTVRVFGSPGSGGSPRLPKNHGVFCGGLELQGEENHIFVNK